VTPNKSLWSATVHRHECRCEPSSFRWPRSCTFEIEAGCRRRLGQRLLLGSAVIHLGAAGIYYRALVGPFASAGKAAKLCSGLKAAGGDYIILKNQHRVPESLLRWREPKTNPRYALDARGFARRHNCRRHCVQRRCAVRLCGIWSTIRRIASFGLTSRVFLYSIAATARLSA
jgi:hypothetical protein